MFFQRQTMTKGSSVSQTLNHSGINHINIPGPHFTAQFSQLHTNTTSTSRRKSCLQKCLDSHQEHWRNYVVLLRWTLSLMGFMDPPAIQRTLVIWKDWFLTTLHQLTSWYLSRQYGMSGNPVKGALQLRPCYGSYGTNGLFTWKTITDYPKTCDASWF